MSIPRLAIIGAGIAGLTLATLLGDRADILVVDKARGVGGRMASRRVGDYGFDHGAQFFTARSPVFRGFLQRWLDAGVIKQWTPRVLTLQAGARPYRRDWFETHYRGVPGMTALPKALSAGLELRLQYEVAQVRSEGGQWYLLGADGAEEGPFDWVVATAPAPQTLAWFPATFSGAASLQTVCYAPCFALMLAFAELPQLRFDAARVKSSSLDWIVRGSNEPGSRKQQTMLLHSTQAWASQQFNEDSDHLIKAMLAELETVLEQQLPAPLALQLHRWRHASAVQTTTSTCELDAANQLAACGDWSVFSDAERGGSRVESAFLSAEALARHMLALPSFAA